MEPNETTHLLPSRSPIPIREARWADLPAIASICTQAFWDDALLADLIHPHREKFPEDMDLWWLRRARINFFDPRRKFFVAVLRDFPCKKGQEVIAGVAHWERIGDGGAQMDLPWYDPRNLMLPLMSLAMKVHAVVWPNRAAHPQHEDVLDRAHGFYLQNWEGERADAWHLDWLAVHPDHQGLGIGRQLVRWGLDEAEKEGICTSVVSADGKDGFYQRAGFEEQIGTAADGKGNPIPLAGYQGTCNIWWRMPKK